MELNLGGVDLTHLDAIKRLLKEPFLSEAGVVQRRNQSNENLWYTIVILFALSIKVVKCWFLYPIFHAPIANKVYIGSWLFVILKEG